MINQDVSFNSTKERVSYGKKVEQAILLNLEKLGFMIRFATVKEDTKNKIDGFIKINNQYVPIQIKYRSRQKDILSEITTIDDQFGNEKSPEALEILDGRDVLSEAKIYVSLSPDAQTLRICLTDDIKTNGVSMTRELIKNWRKNRNCTHLRTKKGEVKVITDNFSGRRKIIYFATPTISNIPSLVEIKLDQPIHV